MRSQMTMGGNVVEEAASVAARCAVATARGRGGRIVGLRVRGVPTVSDIESLRASAIAAVNRAGSGALICADYRLAAPLSRQVANAWARAMRSSNSIVARSGLLLDPANAMFNLQVERVVQCAGNPARRLFVDVGELSSWLDRDLTRSEREALREFLSEGDD